MYHIVGQSNLWLSWHVYCIITFMVAAPLYASTRTLNSSASWTSTFSHRPTTIDQGLHFDEKPASRLWNFISIWMGFGICWIIFTHKQVFSCPQCKSVPYLYIVVLIIHRRRSAATGRHYSLTRVRRTHMLSLKYYCVSRVNTWYKFTKPVICYSIIQGRHQIHNSKWVNSDNLRAKNTICTENGSTIHKTILPGLQLFQKMLKLPRQEI